MRMRSLEKREKTVIERKEEKSQGGGRSVKWRENTVRKKRGVERTK